MVPRLPIDMDEDGMTMVFRVQDPAMLKQVKFALVNTAHNISDARKFAIQRATT